jgi:flavin-dependent dehydrogenase
MMRSFQYILYRNLRKLFPKIDIAIRAAGGSYVPRPLLQRAKIAASIHSQPCNYKLKGAIILGDPALTPPEMACSRAAYEPMLRQLIKSDCANVTFRTGTVTGFEASRSAVVGVLFRNKMGQSVSLPASLLVDATGPTAAGQKWLKKAGFQPPRKYFYSRTHAAEWGLVL